MFTSIFVVILITLFVYDFRNFYVVLNLYFYYTIGDYQTFYRNNFLPGCYICVYYFHVNDLPNKNV